MTFTKLFSSITESTIWVEDDRTRLVWITMLAMCDRRGRVWASIPGLANRARVPVEDAERAVEKFLLPDKYSRTPDFEGKRIEAIDGGWRLLNHEKYRSIRDEEAIKESKRNYINTRRAKERVESKYVEDVEPCRANAEADSFNTHTEGIDEPAGKEPTLKAWTTMLGRYSIPAWYAKKKWDNWHAKNWCMGRTPAMWRRLGPMMQSNFVEDGSPQTEQAAAPRTGRNGNGSTAPSGPIKPQEDPPRWAEFLTAKELPYKEHRFSASFLHTDFRQWIKTA